MPIRLNLLAEDQAAEELRRRDPVKRAIWIGAILAGLMLLWAGWLQMQAFMDGRALSKLKKEIARNTEQFQSVLDLQKSAADVELKLKSLQELAANRFLNGTMLNALQQTAVDNVQLTRLRVDQTYVFTEGTKTKAAGAAPSTTRVLPRPPTWTEKIVLSLEGRDSTPNPQMSDAVDRFKDKIGDHPYFKAALGKTNEVRLVNLTPPQSTPEGGMAVHFTLECRYPEMVR